MTGRANGHEVKTPLIKDLLKSSGEISHRKARLLARKSDIQSYICEYSLSISVLGSGPPWSEDLIASLSASENQSKETFVRKGLSVERGSIQWKSCDRMGR